MKKIMCIIALAAISLGTVEAAIPVKMQVDTTKKIIKKKPTKYKKGKVKTGKTKVITKKDSVKR